MTTLITTLKESWNRLTTKYKIWVIQFIMCLGISQFPQIPVHLYLKAFPQTTSFNQLLLLAFALVLLMWFLTNLILSVYIVFFKVKPWLEQSTGTTEEQLDHVN